MVESQNVFGLSICNFRTSSNWASNSEHCASLRSERYATAVNVS